MYGQKGDKKILLRTERATTRNTQSSADTGPRTGLEDRPVQGPAKIARIKQCSSTKSSVGGEPSGEHLAGDVAKFGGSVQKGVQQSAGPGPDTATAKLGGQHSVTAVI